MFSASQNWGRGRRIIFARSVSPQIRRPLWNWRCHVAGNDLGLWRKFCTISDVCLRNRLRKRMAVQIIRSMLGDAELTGLELDEGPSDEDALLLAPAPSRTPSYGCGRLADGVEHAGHRSMVPRLASVMSKFMAPAALPVCIAACLSLAEVAEAVLIVRGEKLFSDIFTSLCVDDRVHGFTPPRRNFSRASPSALASAQVFPMPGIARNLVGPFGRTSTNASTMTPASRVPTASAASASTSTRISSWMVNTGSALPGQSR